MPACLWGGSSSLTDMLHKPTEIRAARPPARMCCRITSVGADFARSAAEEGAGCLALLSASSQLAAGPKPLRESVRCTACLCRLNAAWGAAAGVHMTSLLLQLAHQNP